MYGAVQSTIKAEVRHVGGNHLHVAAVIAAYRQWPFAIAPFRDVHAPTVIAAHVTACMAHAEIHVSLLTYTLKLQQRVASGIWVLHPEHPPIPRATLVVVLVGGHAILCIVAVRQPDVRPQRHALRLSRLHGAHHLPWVRHVGTDELPPVRQTSPHLRARRHRQHAG